MVELMGHQLFNTTEGVSDNTNVNVSKKPLRSTLILCGHYLGLYFNMDETTEILNEISSLNWNETLHLLSCFIEFRKRI